MQLIEQRIFHRDCPIIQTPLSLRWWPLQEIHPSESTSPENAAENILPGIIYLQCEMFSSGEIFVDEYARFESLIGQWHMERGATSLLSEMVHCPAYEKIMALGPKAIELILARLESEGDDPDHWFWALQVLSGDNPVSEEDEGNLRKMAITWLRWGAEKGYVW
jgi:hypothetical protein